MEMESSSADCRDPHEDFKVVEKAVPYKLQHRNYDQWSKKMLDFIESKGLLGFINGTAKRPPKSTPTVIIGDGPNGGGSNSEEKRNEEEYVAWKESDDRAREWIVSRLTDGIRNQVPELHRKTAQEVWEALPQLATVEHMKKRLNHYLPLYKAAIAGDWKKAMEFIQKEPEAVRAGITSDSETALIVAVKVVRRYNFVEELVHHMSPEEIAICDDDGRTALHRAAGSGNIEATKLLVEKYGEGLLSKEAHRHQTPLFYAAARGDEDTICYLMKRMMATGTLRLEGDQGFHILYHLTISKHYDIALEVLGNNPKLAVFIPKKEEPKRKEEDPKQNDDPEKKKKKKKKKEDPKKGDDLKYHALTALAEDPSSFPSGNNHNFLQEFIYSSLFP